MARIRESPAIRASLGNFMHPPSWWRAHLLNAGRLAHAVQEGPGCGGPRLVPAGSSGSIPIRHRPEGAPAGGTGRRSGAQADAAHVVPLGAIDVVNARHRAGTGIGVPIAAGVPTVLLGVGIADRRWGWRRPVGLA